MKNPPIPFAVMIMAAAAALKLALVFGGRVPFNSDEAVVALMARHILQGERPIFFYGQAYMGSLDAWLISAGFAVFGQQVWVIRLVQTLLYLGVLATTGVLGKEIFHRRAIGLAAMLLLAAPAVNTTLYTTASLGGYGEALLIGNLILLLAIHLGRQLERGSGGNSWAWGALGFLTGLGLWAFGLALVYALPAGVYLAVKIAHQHRKTGELSPGAQPARRRGRWIAGSALVAGFLAGASPWLAAAAGGGLQTLLSELSGAAVAGVEGLPWHAALLRRLLGLILLGLTAALGLRAPWDAGWLALPLIPAALLFWGAVIIDRVKRNAQNRPEDTAQYLLVGVILTLLGAFVVTPFGADPSGRYFLPLAVPLALFAADFTLNLSRRIGVKAYLPLAVLLIFHLWGTVQAALRFPPGITTQFYPPTQVDHRYMGDLISFLRENDERLGFTNYWVSYPLAFLSGEELIFTPRLPYHLDFRYTRRDDRYPAYARQTALAQRTAYITTNHPELDAYLREQFTAAGVGWQEARIGDYQIFYALSRPVQPEELGLGETSGPRAAISGLN